MLLNRCTYSITVWFKISYLCLALLSSIGCSTPDSAVPDSSVNSSDQSDTQTENPQGSVDLKYLALGDSYTIGTGVCSTCSYPVQLKDSLLTITNPLINASVEIIAEAGWTTTKLLEVIENSDLEKNFDLVTLLIGVNNQFQSKPFEIYEIEFIRLLNQAIQFAQDDKKRVIVLSIPDYAYSIFGQNWGDPETTSMEIDAYNNYAKAICENLDIKFLYVTDISREALIRTELLATDGLHLSELAYSEFVERLLPLARQQLESD